MNVELFEITPQQMKSLLDRHLNLNDAEVAALVTAVEVSRPTIVGMYEEDLLGFIGFVPMTVISDTAYMWGYATVGQHKTIFARVAKRIIAKALGMYPTITGDCHSLSSRLWLSWMGAEFINMNRFEFRSVA